MLRKFYSQKWMQMIFISEILFWQHRDWLTAAMAAVHRSHPPSPATFYFCSDYVVSNVMFFFKKKLHTRPYVFVCAYIVAAKVQIRTKAKTAVKIIRLVRDGVTLWKKNYYFFPSNPITPWQSFLVLHTHTYMHTHWQADGDDRSDALRL